MPIPSRQELKRLYQTLTDAEIGERKSVSAATVRRWRRQYEIESRARGPRTKWVSRCTDDEVRKAAAKSTSVAATLRVLGLSDHGSQHATMTTRIRRLGVDTSHFGKSENILGHAAGRIPVKEMFRKGSRHSSTTLRKAIRREGLLEERCALCDLGPTWQGQPLTLQLDHKDGDKMNNALSNLRFLCPNCHAQTPTFTGRNRKSCRGTRHRRGECIEAFVAVPAPMAGVVERPGYRSNSPRCVLRK